MGTGGTKALLVATDGTVVTRATSEYALSTPKPRWSEQDPEDWWRATCASIRRVVEEAGVEPGQIAGVGLTGQAGEMVNAAVVLVGSTL